MELKGAGHSNDVPPAVLDFWVVKWHKIMGYPRKKQASLLQKALLCIYSCFKKT